MGTDLLFKFSVYDKVDPESKKELFGKLLAKDEPVLFHYAATRDHVIFTDRKLIALDIQGMSGSKKEFRIFPYSKITAFSIETAGFWDADCDFKIWVSGVGVFEIKFGKHLDIHEVGELLASKVI